MSHHRRRPITRRDALCRIGNGFGMLAFASLVNESLVRAGAQGQDPEGRKLDHPARAKRVIFLFMNGGLSQVGRPSLGSWLTYGLGTENKNLPGFVVLCPNVPTTVGPPLWGSAFLPAVHQGSYIADAVEKQDEKLVGKEFDPRKLISFIPNEKF